MKFKEAFFIIFIMALFTLSYTKKDDSSKDRKGKKDKKSKKSNKKEKRTSFPQEESKVKELITEEDLKLITAPGSRNMLLIYSGFSKPNVEMNSAFNKLSLSDDKIIEGINFYRVQEKNVTRIVRQQQLTEFPGVFLYNNDQEAVYNYEGDRSSEMLLKFLHSTIKIQIHEVKTPEDLDKIKKTGSNLLLIGDPLKFKNQFNLIAKYSKKYFKNQMWTKNPYFFKLFNIPEDSMDAIAYFTVQRKLNSGERFNIDLENVSKESILKFSEILSRRPYSVVTQYKIQEMLTHKLKTVFYIYYEFDKELDKNLKNLADKYRQEYWFLKTDKSRHIAEPLLETLNILEGHDDTNYPIIAIVDNVMTNKFDLDVYVMDKNVNKTVESIEQFILNHRAGKLNRFIVSEIPHSEKEKEIIEEERREHSTYTDTNNYNKTKHNQIINHSIGLTFQNDMFNQPGKDVIMWISSDTENCLKFTRRFKRVVKKLQSNQNLKWNRLNYLLNEYPGIDLINVPTLIIVPDITINKDKKYFTFEGDFTTPNVIAFITKHATSQIKVEEIPNEEKHKKSEEKKLNVMLKDHDEYLADYELGNPSGNGLIRAVKRFTIEYENNKDDYKDQVNEEDHDVEEYDYNEENGFYKDEL